MARYGTTWKCKDRVASFNKKSDEMKAQAVEDGMKISNEYVTESGLKCFHAEHIQNWTPAKGHTPRKGIYGFISAHVVQFKGESELARISYSRPLPYGHSPIYTDQYNQA